MFCSLEKLKIGMSAYLLLGMFLTAHGEWLHGGLDSKYLTSKGKISVWRKCGNTICGKDALNCHFAVSESDECYQINLPLQLLFKWGSRKKILLKDKKMKIYYFYTDLADILTEKPRVWWLYDNVSKGRNFGTAGPTLDIPVGSVVWKNNAKGPRDGSPLLYAEGNKQEKVALKHNGNLQLDMLEKFTISMWIKTAKGDLPVTLLGGLPDLSTRVALWPTFDRNQLSLAFNGNENEHVYTKKNNTGVDDWRHVAVVYNPDSIPTFFLNGNVWPLEKDFKVQGNRIQPTHLIMWRTVNGCCKFTGQISCVMVFQAALSQSQIKILKDNCP